MAARLRSQTVKAKIAIGVESRSTTAASPPSSALAAHKHQRQHQLHAGEALVRALLQQHWPDAATHLQRQNDQWTLDGASKALDLSLAHSGTWVTAVISNRGPIGVDIEERTRPCPPLEELREWLAVSSITYLQRCEESERNKRFTSLWTLHEAQGKAFKLPLLQALLTPVLSEDGIFAPAFDTARLTFFQRRDGDRILSLLVDNIFASELESQGFQRLRKDLD